MPDQRVSMFVSHKVNSDKQAAVRIKEILQSRTERLDVHVCEEILTGDDWRKWIADRIAHSQILLVLLPHITTDLAWMADEIGRFQGACPTGKLVILKHPSSSAPDFIRNLQIVDISKEQLQEKFLHPLYTINNFCGPDAPPLNPRITDVDLKRDAEEIKDALLGMVDIQTQFYGESLIVETNELDVTIPAGLGSAWVRAPQGAPADAAPVALWDECKRSLLGPCR